MQMLQSPYAQQLRRDMQRMKYSIQLVQKAVRARQYSLPHKNYLIKAKYVLQPQDAQSNAVSKIFTERPEPQIELPPLIKLDYEPFLPPLVNSPRIQNNQVITRKQSQIIPTQRNFYENPMRRFKKTELSNHKKSQMKKDKCESMDMKNKETQDLRVSFERNDSKERFETKSKDPPKFEKELRGWTKEDFWDYYIDN